MDLIVFGMHRSGTSAISGVFQQFGYHVPEPHIAPAADNPRGYFESVAVVNLNEDFLREMDSSWWDPLPIDQSTIKSEFTERIIALIAEHGPDVQLVLKDPRISLLASAWLEGFGRCDRRVGCIHANRHPREVAKSLKSRNGLPPAYAMTGWLKHVLMGEHATRGRPRSFIFFDDVLSDWVSVLDQITGDLQLGGLSISDDMRSRIDGFLARDLKHHAWKDEPFWGARIEHDCELAWQALNLLKERCDDEGAMRTLDGLRDRFNASGSLMRPLLRDRWTQYLETATKQPLRDGARLRVVNSQDIWFVYQGRRHHVTDADVYYALFARDDDVVEALTLADIEVGSPLAAGACLVREAVTSDVYLVNRLQNNRVVKHFIGSDAEVVAFGFDINKVQDVPALAIAGLPDGGGFHLPLPPF